MDYKEFAGKVRSKYPGAYDSVDDMTLAQKVVAKYPDYKSVVDFGSQPSTDTPPEDIGALKSGALGLMSGVPLAETAIAGGKALLGDKSYEEEHKHLEDLKDQAWDQHPVAYGSGKAAGFVGTGLIAPEGIAGAAAIGAGSGIDQAEKPSDMIKEGLEGGAVGGVIGTVGEKVINPLLAKVPGLAKQGLASLGSKTSVEDIQRYLQDPEAIRKALTAPEIAEKLAASARGIGEETGNLADKAKGLLNPENKILTGGSEEPVSMSGKPGQPVVIKGGSGVSINPADSTDDTIRPVFDDMISRFTQSGVAPTAEKSAAVKVLESEYERLSQIAENNGGHISEPDLKSFIKSLQDTVATSAWGNPEAQESQAALKQLSGKLNELLKTSNPAYGEAMKPVADNAELLSGLKKKFGLEEPTRGEFGATENTNSKVANVLAEGKTESQALLERLKGATGEDLQQMLKDSETSAKFGMKGAGGGLRALLPALGYGVGRATGLPFGGIVGAGIGHFGAGAIDGGAVAKRILDAYIGGADKFNSSALKPIMAKFGPILVKAAKAGGNQLAATHFVLATSNPEYQQLADHVGTSAQHE